MRFSPTKILQGLLCSTPVLVLALAACGGGGGGSSSVPPLAAAYTLSVSVSGVSGTVTLHNGGDDLNVAASGVYPFAHQVIAGTSYNISVLAQPSSPTPQLCTVATPTGIMPAFPKTIAVDCVDAVTIGGTITGPVNNGLVLQNNGADNYLVPAGAASFVFATPVVASTTYQVTVLTQPHTQTCTTDASASGVAATDVSSVAINCTNNTTPPPADPYVYAANFGSTGSNGVSPYTSASGVLTAGTKKAAGSGPSSIAVAAGQFAYVTNYSSDTISAYSIDSFGALTSIDADGATANYQASIATGTGTHPYAIAIHPSGRFAYVTNYSSNTISAYSIDSAGALSKIDADGATAGNQASIPARSGPVAIAIDPAGAYAYVANANDIPAGGGSVSVYSIDAATGALTAIPAGGGGTPPYISTGGTAPYSVAVEPDGTHLFVANSGSNTVTIFQIGSTDPGTLSFIGVPATGTTPVSIVIHPAGGFAYVVSTGDNKVYVHDINGAPLSNVTTGNQPKSISIDSTGQYAYVANYGSNSISVYAISSINGLLSPVTCSAGGCTGSNFAAGTGPYAITTAR